MREEFLALAQENDDLMIAMHDERARTEAIRKTLLDMTRATPGPWKAKKNGKGFYRVWTYPHSASTWRTESAKSIPEDWR